LEVAVNVKVRDLMRARVVTAQPHHTVDHVRGLLERNRIHAVPIVDGEGRLLGIVSSTDLVAGTKDATPVSHVMTEKVYAVPAYDDVSVAARVMRNHEIHRVVVTDEQQVVGVLSAFDLLRLVEERRFVMKSPPTRSQRKGSKRR
jgi:CBS domain-containing protein